MFNNCDFECKKDEVLQQFESNIQYSFWKINKKALP